MKRMYKTHFLLQLLLKVIKEMRIIVKISVDIIYDDINTFERNKLW